MNAAGYIRVSTEEQAAEGYGLAAQEQSIRSYCAALRWDLVEVYADAGKSGKALQGRDGLARLLADAQAHRFERLIFWKLDRLGRNLRDLLAVCDQLESLGVGIVSLQESIDTGTPTGRMLRNILGSFAEFERETIVDRIKAGLAQKARQGELVGPLPLGYRRTESGAVELDLVTAPLVREAFTLYATGEYSLRDMTAWAATVGLKSKEGNPLDRLSLRKILTNVSYTGQVARYLRRGGGVVAEGKHPTLVDAGTFAQVQEALEQRRYGGRPQRPYGRDPYPLSGVAVCGFDTVPLLGLRGGNGGIRRYMRCSTAQRQGKAACEQPMVRAELLEAQIAEYVTGMRLPAEYVGAVVADLRQRQRTTGHDETEAGALRRELERWQRLYALGEIDEDVYRRESGRIRRHLAELERPHEVLDVERAVLYLRDVGRIWAHSPRQQQRDFVQEVFARLIVKGPQLTAIVPKALYAPLFVVDRQERFGGSFSMAPRAGFEPTT